MAAQTKTSTKTTAPAAKTTAADDDTQELPAGELADDDGQVEDAPAPKPKAGDYVTTGEGAERRVGLVIGDGREPGEGEGPEPEILWLPGNPAPFGGEITPL